MARSPSDDTSSSAAAVVELVGASVVTASVTAVAVCVADMAATVDGVDVGTYAELAASARPSERVSSAYTGRAGTV